MIYSIYLMDCGKRIEITSTLGLKRVFNIVDIVNRQEEIRQVIRDIMESEADTDLFPLSINNENFLLNCKGRIVGEP